MKLSTLFFGDIADWFQDARIESAEQAANVAAHQARWQQAQTENFTKTAARRLAQLEQDNALLGMILLRLLKQVADKDTVAVEPMVDEIRDILSKPDACPPDNLNFLRAALNLPAARKKPDSTGAVKLLAKRPARPKPGQHPPPPH